MSDKRSRGRPRKFDADRARDQMRNVFWRHGYEATSLEMLCGATAMNRPSLYAAFGDKRAIYRAALETFAESAAGELGRALDGPRTIREALTAFFEAALDLYTGPFDQPLGCFVISTAQPMAAVDDDIREILEVSLDRIDSALERRLARAADEGELSAGMQSATLAALFSAVLQSLTIRARAGAERATLDRIAAAAIQHLLGCGPSATTSDRR